MRRVNLTAAQEPICLTEQRASGNNWYNLPGVCKREVRHILNGMQDGLCIYCERPLTQAHVEHLQSQSAHDTNTLDWGNLSLSCEHDFKSCGHQKGSTALPLLPHHFPQDYPYRVLLDGTIQPRSPDQQWNDIIEAVNLNGQYPPDLNLRSSREARFSALFEQLVEPPALAPDQARALTQDFWRQHGYPTTAISALEACGIAPES